MRLLSAILLIPIAHSATGDAPGEQLVAQCIARESALTSGHIEFTFHVKDESGQETDKNTYYAEWAPGNQVRVGTTQQPDEPILVFDGQVAVTADGTAWPGTMLTDLAVSDEDFQGFADAEVAQLERAQRLYFAVFHQFLKPFSMGGEIDYDGFRMLYAIQTANNSKPLEEPADTLIRAVPTGGTRDLVPVYAIDSKHRLPVAKWIDVTGEEPQIDIRWFGAAPLRDEIAIPEKMISNDWTSGNGLVVFMELKPAASWLGHVEPSRFAVAAHAPDLSRSKPAVTFQERLYDFLDDMEHRGIISTRNLYTLGIMLVLTGSIWFWVRHKRRGLSANTAPPNERQSE